MTLRRSVMWRITVDARMVRVSGIGTYLRSILPGVMERLAGVPFTLLVRPEDREVFCGFPPADLVDVPVRHLSLWEQVAVPLAMPRDTSLLWIPHFNVPLVAAARAPALAVTLHDLFIHEPEHGAPLPRAYARVVFPVIRRYADPVFAVSEFTRSRWLATYPGGVNPLVTPNGVSPDWRDLAEERRAAFDDGMPGLGPSHDPAIPGDRPYLLFVGNLKPHKNILRLLSAFQIIAHRIPHRLVLVGSLEELRTADRRAADLARALPERVLWLGPVEEARLKRLMAGADLFVFPSLYEGFGLPPLEAMAAGIPVAASDIPPVREVCGQAAQYFDPRDEADMARRILELAESPALMARLVAEGRARAALMTWEPSIRTVAEALEARLARISRTRGS